MTSEEKDKFNLFHDKVMHYYKVIKEYHLKIFPENTLELQLPEELKSDLDGHYMQVAHWLADWNTTYQDNWESIKHLDPGSDTLKSIKVDLLAREQVGIKTYGGTVDEGEHDEHYWLEHAYNEALDLVVYLNKLRQRLTK